MTGTAIRPYRPDDLMRVTALFHRAVHVGAKGHYTPAQIAAWAPDEPDTDAWRDRLATQIVFLAERSGTVAGFASLQVTGDERQGLIDLMFVDPVFQRTGVAGTLLRGLESEAVSLGCTCLLTHASLMARPFFAASGFAVLAEQRVSLRGEVFTNFRMKKHLPPA